MLIYLFFFLRAESPPSTDLNYRGTHPFVPTLSPKAQYDKYYSMREELYHFPRRVCI